MTVLVKPRTLSIGLSLLCVLAIWLSLALGPVSLPLLDTLHAALRLAGLLIAPDGLEQAELIVGQPACREPCRGWRWGACWRSPVWQ